MIDKLKQIENKLIIDLLLKPEIWHSVMIDYHTPLVERVWTQINKHRISIHFIHSCSREEALFHPHPWPSAMHVLYGSYEIGLGFGKTIDDVENICTVLVPNGGLYYDMTNIDGWHYVRSTESVCATIMLTGEPWGRESTEINQPLKELSQDRKSLIIEYFLNYYKAEYKKNRIKENMTLQKGDWIELDQTSMSSHERKLYQGFIGIKGYVIKLTETLIDVRFGNDRIQLNSCFVKKMKFENSEKPIDKKIDKSKDYENHEDYDPDFFYEFKPNEEDI